MLPGIQTARLYLSSDGRYFTYVRCVALKYFNQIDFLQVVDFISLFRDLHVLEMDRCDLDVGQLKQVLLDQPLLHSLKCSLWTHSSVQQSRMADLQGDFRHCRLQTNKQSFSLREEDEQVLDRRTMAVKVLDEYAGYAPVLNHEFYT